MKVAKAKIRARSDTTTPDRKFSAGRRCLKGESLSKVFFRQVGYFLTLLPAIVPPPQTDAQYQQIRHRQHIQDAGIQSAWVAAAGFQIGFGRSLAHGALGSSGFNSKGDNQQRQRCEDGYFKKSVFHNRLFSV